VSTPELSHREIEELLGAYALDAVDPETAALVEVHLERCVRCSIEVAQYHEVAGMLANSGGRPPARLWNGIAERLGGTSGQSWGRLAARLEAPEPEPDPDRLPDRTPAVPDHSGSEPVGAGRRRRVTIATAALAAAAVIVALGLGLQVRHLHTQVRALESAPQLSAAERAAEASPTTRRIPLVHAAGSAAPATVVLSASGTGFVVNHDLPALPADRTYQLWGVVGSHTVSLGLLGSRPGIVPFSVAGAAEPTAFAVSSEHAGGAVQPSGRPVAASAVTA